MAEIDIQKKKPSTWLWIIGLIILALLIWLLIELFGGRGSQEYTSMALAMPLFATPPFPRS